MSTEFKRGLKGLLGFLVIGMVFVSAISFYSKDGELSREDVTSQSASVSDIDLGQDQIWSEYKYTPLRFTIPYKVSPSGYSITENKDFPSLEKTFAIGPNLDNLSVKPDEFILVGFGKNEKNLSLVRWVSENLDGLTVVGDKYSMSKFKNKDSVSFSTPEENGLFGTYKIVSSDGYVYVLGVVYHKKSMILADFEEIIAKLNF